MNYQILVNKTNPVDKFFIPESLIEYLEYNGEKIAPDHKTLVEKETLFAFFKMQAEAKKAGYAILIDSAYRSYEYQKKILDKVLEEKGEEAYKTVALPGTSEHQTGLAIDIALSRNGIYCDDFDDSAPEIQWLINNAYRFGFILRYPKGKENVTGYNYEYWHFRYVGKELSMYMKDNQITTLEEYYINKNNIIRKECN